MQNMTISGARWKRTLIGVGCGTALLVNAACSAIPMPAPTSVAPVAASTAVQAAVLPTGVHGTQVVIDNFTFSPATLIVEAGTEVTWTNQDDIPHTVKSADNRSFAAPALDTDEHFSFRFTTPGTYIYYCAIHPRMTAQVTVQ